MIRRLLRSTAQRLAGQVSAGLSLFGDRASDRFGILMYHRVADRVPGVEEPSINVTPRQFRSQLAGLVKLGYRFVSLGKLLDQIAAGESIPPHTVVVTFDDGHQSVFTDAWPTLQELQIPATIFLNTAFIDSEQPFPFDRWAVAQQQLAPPAGWRPLTGAQCREMAGSGLIELGAHTHTHEDFRGRPGAFELDLRTCLSLLRSRYEIEHPTFAFPFGRKHLGYVTPAMLDAARRTGVRCALTTECELISPAADPFGWGRFNVYDWDSARTLAARLRGWYDWAPGLQSRLGSFSRPTATQQETGP